MSSKVSHNPGNGDIIRVDLYWYSSKSLGSTKTNSIKRQCLQITNRTNSIILPSLLSTPTVSFTVNRKRAFSFNTTPQPMIYVPYFVSKIFPISITSHIAIPIASFIFRCVLFPRNHSNDDTSSHLSLCVYNKLAGLPQCALLDLQEQRTHEHKLCTLSTHSTLQQLI